MASTARPHGKVNLAFGLSARGLLAFQPNVTWGIENDVSPFTGHTYSKGTVTLTRIPISIDGEMVVNIDPDGHGRMFGQGEPDGVILGVDGQLNAAFNLASTLSFSLPLAHASMGSRITSTHSYGYISGDIAPEITWLPALTPLVPNSSVRAAGYVDSDGSSSHFSAEGTYGFKSNKLPALAPSMPPIPMVDFTLASATLSASKNGLSFAGTTTLSPLKFIPVTGTATVAATFPVQPDNFSIALGGSLGFPGFPLGGASVLIDKAGAAISGNFVTPLSSVAMTGQADLTGTSFTGSVNVSLYGARDVLQTVTDGVLCGYDYTTNGAVCGYDTVVGGSVCGSSYVANGAACGYHSVTDAAQCGTHTISSGAECGWNYVKTGAACIASGFKPSKCRKPKSCNVASTCDVASSCNVPNTCQVARSCADLSKPKTCTTHATVPNSAFGAYAGTISVRAEGTVSAAATSTGTQCETISNAPLPGSTKVCTPIASAKVTLGSNPHLCMSVQGAIGDVCGDFRGSRAQRGSRLASLLTRRATTRGVAPARARWERAGSPWPIGAR